MDSCAASNMRTAMSERKLVFLIGSVQLILTLDFTMVLPLGPDFAKALDIPTSQLGMVGASYTAAAAVVGIAGAFFLDRFDRRRALTVALTGLVLGTAAGGFATGFASMVAARVVAGVFGGIAETLAYTIVSGAPLDGPKSSLTINAEGTPVELFTADGRRAATWERLGHTCVLTGKAVPDAKLAQLAGWKAKGALNF